jgi:Fe-S-cluster containining protein
MPRPWYKSGLHFKCTHCNRCCTVEGHVWVDKREAQRLANHLQISLQEFSKRYLRLVDGRHALTERSDGACVFWDEGCTVYETRPGQCRTFPFWEENVATRGAWEEVAEECEGIGEGRLYQLGEIRSMIRGRSATVDGDPLPLEGESESSD